MAEESQVDPGKKLLEQYEIPDDPESNPPLAVEPEVSVDKMSTQNPVESKPKHPKAILTAAKNVGMDESDIAEYETTADLKEAVSILAMTQKQERRQDNIDNSVRRDPRTGQFVKQTEPPEPEKEFDLKDVGVDLSDFDEDTQGRLAKSLTPLAKQVAELRKQLEQAQQRDMQREVNSTFDQLDQMFIKNSAIFGEGERHDMDRTSDEFARRNAVMSEMSRIHANGESVSLKADYAKAVKRLGFTVQEAPAAPVEQPKREIADPHGYRNGHTNMPTTRMPVPEKKGTKTAVSAVATLLKNRISDAEDDDDELGLPER